MTQETPQILNFNIEKTKLAIKNQEELRKEILDTITQLFIKSQINKIMLTELRILLAHILRTSDLKTSIPNLQTITSQYKDELTSDTTHTLKSQYVNMILDRIKNKKADKNTIIDALSIISENADKLSYVIDRTINPNTTNLIRDTYNKEIQPMLEQVDQTLFGELYLFIIEMTQLTISTEKLTEKNIQLIIKNLLSDTETSNNTIIDKIINKRKENPTFSTEKIIDLYSENIQNSTCPKPIIKEIQKVLKIAKNEKYSDKMLMETLQSLINTVSIQLSALYESSKKILTFIKQNNSKK